MRREEWQPFGFFRFRLPRGEELLPLLFPVLVMAMGLTALLSTLPLDQRALFYKQLFFDLLGVMLILFLVFSFPHTRRIEEWTPLFYIAAILGLLLVLLVGRIGGGSRRWLDLGIVNLQPSEFAKLALLLTLSRFLAENHEPQGYGMKELLLPLFLLAIPAGLVLIQPDLGTALLLLLTGALLLVVHGVRRRVLVTGIVLALLSSAFAWEKILRPYQKHRILAFLDPYADPLGKGYHLLQSQIALGSGGFFGKSFGTGLLSNLAFLPEHHTDFIFAAYGELWGFAGGLFLIAVYGGLLYWLYHHLKRIQELYPFFVVAGVLLHFSLHFFINMGMVVGLLPVVGIPLPWLSYGGSATLVNAFLFGYAWFLIRNFSGESKHFFSRTL